MRRSLSLRVSAPSVRHGLRVLHGRSARNRSLSETPLTFRRVGSRIDPRVSRHIGDLYPTLEQVERAAEIAQDLMAHPGWRLMQVLAEAEIATIDAELDTGKLLETRAHYAAKHGRRGGIRFPQQAVEALVADAERRMAEQRAKYEGAATASGVPA